jgi:hypothetical protein
MVDGQIEPALRHTVSVYAATGYSLLQCTHLNERKLIKLLRTKRL